MSKPNQNLYTTLAKEAIEHYLKTGKILVIPKDLPEELTKIKAGVFVTLYNKKHPQNGEKLRGCIGTFLPVYKNIAEEIIYNAIAAATEDYRFEPITIEELPGLACEVSILSEPEQINDIKQLDAKKYGIIVESNHKRGLLLPDIDGVDSPEQQINIAAGKGGIDLKKEKIKLYRFEVKKHK